MANLIENRLRQRRRVRGSAGTGWQRRGFTLMEMIIVIGLTAIIMGMLFIPLSRMLDLTQRSRAKVEGQAKVRNTVRFISREISNALEVYEPRPLNFYGYNQWQFTGGGRQRPQPAAGAVPEAYQVKNACLAFRLPKHRYFCPDFDHYVAPADQPTNAQGFDYSDFALDSCPRHPGHPVEFKALMPVEPDRRIVAYFVALKDPGRRSNGQPAYANLLLFRTVVPTTPSAPNTLNTYALYRVEFDPADPAFGNWMIDPGDGSGLVANPNFFYDTAASPNGRPYWENWLALVRGLSANPNNGVQFDGHGEQLMEAETSDMVRWVETGRKMVPHPLCTFGPSALEDETLQPNRDQGNLASTHPGGPPIAYEADHGNWAGWPWESLNAPRDGSWTIWDQLAISDSAIVPPPAGTVQQGARIQILEQTATGIAPVFDSRSPAIRNRLVSYDPVSGRVILGIPRRQVNPQPGAGQEYLAENYSAPTPSLSANPLIPNYSVDLSQDVQLDQRNMPASFGAALNGGFKARFGPTLTVAPFSESVEILNRSSSPPQLLPLRRVGWVLNNDRDLWLAGSNSRVTSSQDRDVAQADLGPLEYTIDYRTGIITLSDRDPTRWTSIQPGTNVELLVRYLFQTNAPKIALPNNNPDTEPQLASTDVVKVSYITKEMLGLHVGVIQYTRSKQEVIPFEVSERVMVRNFKR